MTTKTPAKRGLPFTTGRQTMQLILNFIWEYRAVYGNSPTYVEIAKGIGYASAGSTYSLVNRLIAEGWLRHALPNSSRSLMPVKPRKSEYCAITDSLTL